MARRSGRARGRASWWQSGAQKIGFSLRISASGAWRPQGEVVGQGERAAVAAPARLARVIAPISRSAMAGLRRRRGQADALAEQPGRAIEQQQSPPPWAMAISTAATGSRW
jgi:hypothetical protein